MSRKSSQSFVAPRGDDGKFIPRDQWPKKVQKEFDRLQRQGAFKVVKQNPIVKSSSGRRRGKNIWIPPQDKNGQFLPMSQWSQTDKKAYRRALKGGLVPGSLVPRGYAGRFAVDAASPSSRSRRAPTRAIQVRPDETMMNTEDQDLFDVRRGIRRIEHRIEDLLFEIDDMRPMCGRGRDINVRRVPDATVLSAIVPRSDAFIEKRDKARGGTAARRHSLWRGTSPAQKRRRLVADIPEVWGPEERREYEDYDDAPYIDEYGSEAVDPGDVAYARSAKCDDCQIEILEGIRSIGESCKSILGRTVSRGKLSRNSTARAMMYNRPRVPGQRFDEVLGYLKEHPVVAIIGIGALALVGFAIYKLIRTIMSNIVAGAAIQRGVMSFPGSDPYMITQDDALWLIRAIWGEVNRSNQHWETSRVQQGSAAVMWALANNYMTVGQKRRIYPTFGQYIQAYCQPINPIYMSADALGCQRNPGACSVDTLEFRQALRSKPWAQFPAGAQALVTAFVDGTLVNPIGRRTDWAAAGAGRTGVDAVNVAGNVFLTDPSARGRTAAA